jgi:hypothetical protein
MSTMGLSESSMNSAVSTPLAIHIMNIAIERNSVVAS